MWCNSLVKTFIMIISLHLLIYMKYILKYVILHRPKKHFGNLFCNGGEWVSKLVYDNFLSETAFYINQNGIKKIVNKVAKLARFISCLSLYQFNLGKILAHLYHNKSEKLGLIFFLILPKPDRPQMQLFLGFLF